MLTFCFVPRMRYSTEGSRTDGKRVSVPFLDLHAPIIGSSSLDDVVSAEERRAVAKEIRANWRHIGEALGPDPKFRASDLDGFEEKGNNRDRAQAMLDAWAERHHKGATRKMLILALKEEGYGAFILKVFKCDPDSVTAQPSPPSQDSESTSKAMLFLFL